VNFKYEKLGVFCFVCGFLGHAESRCAVRFAMDNDDGSRAWSKELRAEPRRRMSKQTSRWLTEEVQDRPLRDDSQTTVSGDDQVDPTTYNIPPSSPNQNRQNINQQSLQYPTLVPSATHNRHSMTHSAFTQPLPVPAITAPTDNLNNNNNSLVFRNGVEQPAHLIHKPQPNIHMSDNQLNDQSLPNNHQPFPSITLSPIITEALNKNPTQFSFTANSIPSLKQPINPITRTIKHNPTHKHTRTGPSLNRTGPNPDPSKPVADMHVIMPVSMETQTEKKRRRENEKETDDNSNLTQHFLTAGPGSQACRDQ
jgi:hypothetical protein